jgi:hypothetical protein
MGVVYSRCTYSILFLSGRGLEDTLQRLHSVGVRPLRRVLGLPGSAHIISLLAGRSGLTGPTCSSRRKDRFRTARKVLFIIAAFLRTVRDLLHSVDQPVVR